jgi:TRAP-type uncharacterized transport system substrate-binding protein
MVVRPSSRVGRGRRLALVLLAVALLGALAWMALTIGNPFPPRRVVMATGPEGSAFGEFGDRYRQILQRSGVDLQLVQTAGGAENLQRLRDPYTGVSVAFVENGQTSRDESPDLVSLGAVTLEPLWVFSRSPSSGSARQQLVGKRISIEPEGSSTRVLARRLLQLNGIDEANIQLLGLAPQQSADALLRGDIDVAILLTSWRSPVVQRLLVADGIGLQGYPRADAYVARFPNLDKVVLPTGVADFARNIPPADVPMIAVEASLVVRKEIHPALQYLLLEAAEEVHSGPEIFYRAGRFPAPDAIDLPLSDPAQAFYKSGRPFVYRYLPFWMAGLAERLMILLIPLFTVVFPLAHFVPMFYAFVIQRRIFGLYGELKVLETEMEALRPGDPGDPVAAELERLAKRANRLRVPLGFAQRLFILKSHIALALQEVEKRRISAGEAPRAGGARTDPAGAGPL